MRMLVLVTVCCLATSPIWLNATDGKALSPLHPGQTQERVVRFETPTGDMGASPKPSPPSVAPDPNKGFDGISLLGEGDDEKLKLLVRRSPKATKARLGWLALNDSSLTELARATELEEIEIGGVNGWDQGRPAQIRISEKGWAALAALPKLRRLTVYLVPIDEEGCRSIAHLKAVTDLDLSSCGLNDRAVQQLAAMTRLTRLQIRQEGLSAKALADVVSKFEWLEHLALPSTAVGDREMNVVAKLPRLKTLCIHDTRVGDEGILALAASRTLKEVTVHLWKSDQRGETVRKVELLKSSGFIRFVGAGAFTGVPGGVFGAR